MNDLDLVKLLGQSGIAVAALYVLAWLVKRVGERMIAAIDRVGVKIDEHTKADTQALAQVGVAVGELRLDIAVLGQRVDTVIDWGERTPVGGQFVESLPIHRKPEELDEPERPERSPRERQTQTPTGEYSFRRPPPERSDRSDRIKR